MRVPPPRRRRHPSALLVTAALMAAMLPTTVAVAATTDGPTTDLKVHSGQDASIDDLPSLAFVTFERVSAPGSWSACTGTVIAPEWVLTAAHCFETTDPARVRVFTGSAVPVWSAARTAAAVIIHPDWDFDPYGGTGFGDVALVRLAQPTDAPAQPLVAAGTPVPVGADATIAGWGMTGPNEWTEVLQHAEVPVVDPAWCTMFYGRWFDAERSVCAGAGSGQPDTCPGDSGGPLLVDRGGELVQYGITNYGQDAPCGAQSAPAVYASVAYYRNWIDAVAGTTPISEPALDPDTDPLSAPASDALLFADVRAGSAHEPGIAAVAAAGITTGFADGTFGPDVEVTRGQMATFLVRASGGLEPAAGLPWFLDVAPGNVHAAAIAAVADAGITTGFADGTFGPDVEVTRGQMATFLVRTSSGLEPSASPPSFLDVAPGNVHAAAIAAVAEAGIATGFADGSFGPDVEVTRGQMATFLARTFLWGGPTPPTSG